MDLGLQIHMSQLQVGICWEICEWFLIRSNDKYNVGSSWVNMAEHTRTSRSSRTGGYFFIQFPSSHFDLLCPGRNATNLKKQREQGNYLGSVSKSETVDHWEQREGDISPYFPGFDLQFPGRECNLM